MIEDNEVKMEDVSEKEEKEPDTDTEDEEVDNGQTNGGKGF